MKFQWLKQILAIEVEKASYYTQSVHLPINDQTSGEVYFLQSNQISTLKILYFKGQ